MAQAGRTEMEITLEGFGPKEAKELKELLLRFLREYGEKPAEQGDEQWLTERFLAELPELPREAAQSLSRETLACVQEYDETRDSLLSARRRGATTEEWFTERSREAAVGMSALEFGRRMERLGDTLSEANAQIYRTITTQSGEISQQMNLDGFLAEQQHVNSFNLAAKLSGSPFRAEVCVPEPGQTYGENSFDVVIRGGNGRIVHQYQFKYGADADATIQMLRRGNYNNQTLVVPPEQVEAVQAAFPGKTVVAQIGGTDTVPVSSKPLSKADVKAMQQEIQTGGKIPESDWNSFDNRMLSRYVGQQAVMAGMLGAALGAGFHIASRLAVDEPIEGEAVVADALSTGTDAGIKAAAAGALKVAMERGILAVAQPGMPMPSLTCLACVAVENAKVLIRVVEGELTVGEALDQMACNASAMYYGMAFGMAGSILGAFALGWIPIAGPIIGGVIGGVIGYTAGAELGDGIYQAAKNAAKAAVKTVKRMTEGAKKVAGKLFRGVGRLVGLT